MWRLHCVAFESHNATIPVKALSCMNHPERKHILFDVQMCYQTHVSIEKFDRMMTNCWEGGEKRKTFFHSLSLGELRSFCKDLSSTYIIL